jgi:hypothetical protein
VLGSFEQARVPKLRTVPLLVEAQPRFVRDFPALEFIPPVTRQLAISEFRGSRMWWLETTPRS